MSYYPMGVEIHPQAGKTSLEGEAYAFSEMSDHVSMLRGFYARFSDLSQGLAGHDDCESLLTHLKNRQIATEKFSVRRFPAIQQVLETQELGNVYWHPGLEYPADGLAKTKSDIWFSGISGIKS